MLCDPVKGCPPDPHNVHCAYPKCAKGRASAADLKRLKLLTAFALDIADNYDHEADAHRHNNGACRVCKARKVLIVAATPEDTP